MHPNRLILFLIPFCATSLFFGISHAQTVPIVSTANCTVFAFNQVPDPFTVTLDHDPALSKTVTEQHNDPASALQMSGADPIQLAQNLNNAQTHMSFSSNNTDTWMIQVTIKHPESNTSHKITANLYSGPLQNLESSTTVHYSGDTFCGIFQMTTVPPVHIPTLAETLKIAQQLSNESYNFYNDNMKGYAVGTTTVGNNIGLIGLGVILEGIVFLIMNWSEKRKIHEEQELYELSKKKFDEATEIQRMNLQHNRLEFEDLKNETRQEMENFYKQVIESQKRSETNIYYAMTDLSLVIRGYAEKNSMQDFKPTPLIEVKPITFPEEIPIVEVTIPKNSESGIKSLRKSIISIVKKPKDENISLEDKWYNEYKRGIANDEYKGELQKIWKEEYPKAQKDLKGESRAKIEAIARIVKENGDIWP